MPRGGSKKGEHRGNAKPRDENSPNAVMKRAVAPPRPGKRRQHITQIEADVFIGQVINGIQSAYDMTPEQIMLDNMQDFQNGAYEIKAMKKYLAETLPDNDQTRATIRDLEREEFSLRKAASDEARNVAPYIHPRKQAVAFYAASNAASDIVKDLFDLIDQRNREHPMVIEHMPTKRTA